MPYEIECDNVRVHAQSNMGTIAIQDLDYSETGTAKELSIIMTADCSHIRGGVPISDILKYVLLHRPELIQEAQQQLEELAEEQHVEKLAAAEAREIEAQDFCDAFLAEFPSKRESGHLACDRSDTWMHVIDGAPTTGEGCIINGLPAYNTYNESPNLYEFGILRTVVQWAASQGWYGENHDAGTLKFFRLPQ